MSENNHAVAGQRIGRALYQIRSEVSLIGFGPILDRFEEVVCAPKHPTMATDGKKLYYGPDFVMRCPDAVLRTIVVHEAMHVSLAHHVRLRDGPWELKRANVAMDHIINNMIMQTEAYQKGFLLAPADEDWVCDPKYADAKWTWEEVYKDLPVEEEDPDGDESDEDGGDDDDGEGEEGEGQDKSDDGSGDSSGSGDKGQGEIPEGIGGGPGEILPAPPEVVTDDEIQEINEDLAQGEFMQKMAGSGSGTERIFRTLRDAQNDDLGDWDFMRDLLQDAYNGERTWAKPNVFFLDHGYLPSKKPSTGTLHAQFDMSASMTEREIKVCYANLLAMAQELGLSKIKVGYFDTKILRPSGESWMEYDCMAGEKPEITMVGRGGTDFTPIFTSIEEEAEDVTALVIFTDGEAAVHDRTGMQVPEYAVIWATTGIDPTFWGVPEFGTIVNIKVREWWKM